MELDVKISMFLALVTNSIPEKLLFSSEVKVLLILHLNDAVVKKSICGVYMRISKKLDSYCLVLQVLFGLNYEESYTENGKKKLTLVKNYIMKTNMMQVDLSEIKSTRGVKSIA